MTSPSILANPDTKIQLKFVEQKSLLIKNNSNYQCMVPYQAIVGTRNNH